MTPHRFLPLLALLAAACHEREPLFKLSPGGGTISDAARDGSETSRDGSSEAAVSPLPTALPFDAAGCIHPPVTAKCSTGYCEIPAGCYVHGSPEDEPARGPLREQRVAVTLTRSFLIQQRETTQAEWVAFGLSNPSGTRADGSGDCSEGACPVGNVNWFEALAFANLVSQRHEPPLPACYVLAGCTGEIGKGMKCTGVTLKTPTVYDCTGFRLPTDAEWEYAARAGTLTAYYTGVATVQGNIGDCYADLNLLPIAWYCHNSGLKTHPVGGLVPNGFGLYDMLGNAMEWVNDVSTGLPPAEPVDPGKTLGTSVARIVRGGAANLWATTCRAAFQHTGSWDAAGPGGGFRLVRTLTAGSTP